MKKNIACNTHDCFLCRNCISEWQPAIVSNKQNIVVKKGQPVFSEGDAVNGIYFVYEGNVKVHKKWGDEKELIIRFANKGSILGHRGLNNKSPIYPVSATALEKSILCYFDKDFLTSSLKVNSDFTYNLLMFFADELHEAEIRMRNLAHMPVKGRVAQALLSLKNQFKNDGEGYMAIELSRQDLASFTGATYETVFRVLNDMTLEKIIVTKGRKIKIIDFDKILSLVKKIDL